MAEPGVLFFAGSDNGEHAKCSKLLSKHSQNGFFVGTTSHCTTAHIQQTSAHRNDTNKTQKQWSIEHSLVMVPVFKKFIQGRLVTCKTKYGKWKCTSCDKFVHSYCSCTSGLMFCTDCFGNHHPELAMDDYKRT